MSTETVSRYEIIENLPAESALVLHNRSWEDYEGLLDAVGENSGLRIWFDSGGLHITTLSPAHATYEDLIQDIVRLVSLRMRIKLLSFGSVTMKLGRKKKGVEPDHCFYVQSADAIKGKNDIDFSTDPPPDVVVEIDLHHESLSKLPIYVALGVSEIWRYDGQRVVIYHLEADQYVVAAGSLALPILTADVLTEFLTRCQQEDQYEALLAFEAWLGNQQL